HEREHRPGERSHHGCRLRPGEHQHDQEPDADAGWYVCAIQLQSDDWYGHFPATLISVALILGVSAIFLLSLSPFFPFFISSSYFSFSIQVFASTCRFTFCVELPAALQPFEE